MVLGKAYIGAEDVFRDVGLVDTRVLVCLEVGEGLVRDALGNRRFYWSNNRSASVRGANVRRRDAVA